MPTGTVNRAEHHLHQMNGATGLKPVAVSRDTTHGVHRHRSADELIVLSSGPVGPWRIYGDGLAKRHMCHFECKTLNGVGINASGFSYRRRRIFFIQIALRQQRHDSFSSQPFRGLVLAKQGRLRRYIRPWLQRITVEAPDQFVVIAVPCNKPVICGAGVLNNQLCTIGVAGNEVGVEKIVL